MTAEVMGNPLILLVEDDEALGRQIADRLERSSGMVPSSSTPRG